MRFTRTLARWFPVPRMLVPHGTGVDITDASVKWLSLTSTKNGARIENYGNEPLAPGIVQMGAVRDTKALGAVLAGIKKRANLVRAHAALPEEAAYVFSMHVPNNSSRAQILNMIEFELENRVPIPPSQTVYDFDTIGVHDDHGEEIAVTVFPLDLAEGYSEAFALAGIELASLEIEARSIARAVSGAEGDPVTLLVDCGRARTGVAILKHGFPIFTSTVDIGGEDFSKAVIGTGIFKTEDEARVFKNEHGLVREAPELIPANDAVEKVAALLAGEVVKHYRFWDTRRTQDGKTSSVERVYLLGGGANLRGLPEYIAGKVQVEAERPNVWRNAFSFASYVPPIDARASFQYATAVGLALRNT